MKTRCPSCGATASLDVLVGHDDARNALQAAFNSNGKLGRALVSYLALFRSKTRDLSFDRVATLMNEIQPDIDRGEIRRDRVDYPAPIAAWLWAIEQTIKARDDGKLSLPLTKHGYLYAVITQFKPEQYSAAHTDFAQRIEPASAPKIQLTPAQVELEKKINATTNRLKTKENM